jgi:flagellar biosynthetic protein FlhB
MAEESDFSRTEPASPRRLQQARQDGDVPRSSELSAWVVLLTALGALNWLASSLFATLGHLLQTSLLASAHEFPAHPFALLLPVVSALLPMLALILLALLVAPMLLSGWVFAPRALAFNARQLDPLAAWKRLFSLDGLFVIGKSALKFALVAAVCWTMLANDFRHLLPGVANDQFAPAAASVLLSGLLSVVGALAAFALADAGWQWWRYRTRHAMSWQEVQAEAQESEGSPEMRARVRQRQQEMGKGVKGGTSPLPNPLPLAGEGTNAEPRAIDE